ncbi:MAG TPA: DUF3857 domain-containing protein, partial [Patescibacteria group bacterium]|nr:DUF3857 domain-containing protein [Patescibacteria group bacterium]
MLVCSLDCYGRITTSEAFSTGNEPFAGSNVTFVLVSGLPGDIESENAFQDQLRGWLEFLSIEQRAKRCVVFCDQPSAVKPPDAVRSQTFKADRANLLSLPEKIGSVPGQLRIIVWGHGGNQGATPVFHVRGPRLTPSDFASVAAKLPEGASQWVFLFRGSGAFAQAIAKPGRIVLASDDGTMFGSDPNGMPLLLKELRNHPATAFGPLAENFGRQTAGWFAERNLARTEEPTLWIDEQQPRHLAQSASELAKPVAGSTEETQVSIPEPVKSKTQSLLALAAGWDGIKKVRPEDYPDSDAVVLRSRHVSVLGTSPALSTEREEFIQVLQPEGTRLGDFDVSFAPPEEELEFLDCEVLRADGQIERMDPDLIHLSGEPSPGEYQTVRRKVFSLPGVTPGSILHVRYRSQWKDYPLPRVSMEIPLARDIPVLQAAVVVRIPKGSSFHYRFENGSASEEPTRDQSGYSTSYSWLVTNIAPCCSEPLAPHQRPALRISTFADWHEFAEWYSHITRLTAEISPELKEKAQALARDASSSREKVEAVFNYVTGLRYVEVPLGVNSLRPHAAANVFQNQFGDCKDKANLLNALLHALSIEADLVLVPRFGQAYQELPGLSFNHAISRVNADGKTFWLDCTDEVCRFDFLPPGDSGRNVLVIDGRTSALCRLDSSDSSSNRLSLRGKLRYAEGGRDFSLDLGAVGSGCGDYQLRSAFGQGKERGGALPLLMMICRPASGSFAMEHQNATPVAALDRAFEWRGQGKHVGLLSRFKDSIALHSPFWIPREWDVAIHARRSSLLLNEGYPLTLEEQFEIVMPPETESISLPERA